MTLKENHRLKVAMGRLKTKLEGAIAQIKTLQEALEIAKSNLVEMGEQLERYQDEEDNDAANRD